MMKLFNGKMTAKYVASPKAICGLVRPWEFDLNEKMGEFKIFDANTVYTIALEADNGDVRIAVYKNGNELDVRFPSNSNLKNLEELGVKSLDMFAMLSEVSLEDIYNLYVDRNQKATEKEKIIDLVLKNCKDEYIQNVYRGFVDTTVSSGVMNNGSLFDILTAYHDGTTSLAISEIVDCEAKNTLYYDSFYILLSGDESLNLVFENTLRPIQPSFLINETTIVEKITVMEKVGLDSPGITIILETSNGFKYGIGMRTTNLIINKNMEVK